MASRLRVIYADLTEFIGTTAEWGQVRDGILIVQIEQQPGDWVALQGEDWYFVLGDQAVAFSHRDSSDLETSSDTVIRRRKSQHERAGKLVGHEVWQRAKAMMREPPPRR
jgi:hypothetical protein